MADGGSRGSPEVQHLGTRLHVDVLYAANDGGSQLGSERVPRSVLCLGVPVLSAHGDKYITLWASVSQALAKTVISSSMLKTSFFIIIFWGGGTNLLPWV